VLISIIVPVWNDASSIPVFLDRFSKLQDIREPEYEFIFCVDPSFDRTKSVIQEISIKNEKVKALFFNTRVGQGTATFAGLVHCQGDCAVIIDVDLQDPIELIPQMVELWVAGFQHVLPRRISRTGEPFTKRFTAYLGYLFLSKFGTYAIPKNTGDFRLIDRKIINNLIKMKELNIFLRGLTAIINDSPKIIEFHRPKRSTGQTKYNRWFGGIRSGINGLISYSNIFLEIFFYTGTLLAFVSFMLGARYLWFKVNGIYIPEGITQLFVALTFIGGLILMGIGILGLYVGRIFDEVKGRPRWTIESAANIPDTLIKNDQ